ARLGGVRIESDRTSRLESAASPCDTRAPHLCRESVERANGFPDRRLPQERPQRPRGGQRPAASAKTGLGQRHGVAGKATLPSKPIRISGHRGRSVALCFLCGPQLPPDREEEIKLLPASTGPVVAEV